MSMEDVRALFLYFEVDVEATEWWSEGPGRPAERPSVMMEVAEPGPAALLTMAVVFAVARDLLGIDTGFR